jgi:hypothetical protein
LLPTLVFAEKKIFKKFVSNVNKLTLVESAKAFYFCIMLVKTYGSAVYGVEAITRIIKRSDFNRSL